MSVKYSIAALRNPRKMSDPPKYYAKAQADGHLPLETICEAVSHAGSIIRGDVLAVSDGLIHQMVAGLKEGKIIELGDFGRFQVQLQSNGSETEKEFTAGNISKATIQFRPGKKLVEMLKILQYQQVPKKPVKVVIGGNEVG